MVKRRLREHEVLSWNLQNEPKRERKEKRREKRGKRSKNKSARDDGAHTSITLVLWRWRQVDPQSSLAGQSSQS